MDSKIFIKIPGSNFNQGKEYEVSSLSWGTGRGIGSTGYGSNQSKPSPGVTEFVITCPVSNQTVVLQQAAVGSRPPFDVEIVYRKPLNRGWMVAQTFKAKSVMVSGFSVSGGGARPTCAVTFNATSITFG